MSEQIPQFVSAIQRGHTVPDCMTQTTTDPSSNYRRRRHPAPTASLITPIPFHESLCPLPVEENAFLHLLHQAHQHFPSS